MYRDLLNVVCDWVSEDACNRKVEIEANKGKFEKIGVLDFDKMEGATIVRFGKVVNSVKIASDIDTLIDKLKVDRRREEYERLKKEFGEEKQ